MSEFTSGTLFLERDADEIKKAIGIVKQPLRVEKLNDKWGVILLQDDFLSLPQSVEELLTLSRTAPILNFYNAEDHGWGYRLMENGEHTAWFDMNYELEYEYYMQLVDQRYPDEDPFLLPEELQQAINDEIQKLPEFQKKLTAPFKNANVARFNVLQVNTEELERLFEPGRQDQVGGFTAVEEFKRILGIEEMAWKSYELSQLVKTQLE
jgi:hypothetical protein